MSDKPIYVTQPSLAPLEEYVELLKGVWGSGILTHNGPLVQQFEKELATKLGIQNFVTVTNGTVALQMAIKALELKGEIITTPFTWIATVSAIKWEGCLPVFCDIEPDTFNIDPAKIEALITDKTVGIMPVHVFGNPCDVDAIDAIAKKHNLKVIYDAAHAIGSTCKGKSVLEFGDISATSLHATKLLNTGEGGGCVTTDEALHDKLKRIRFFGHDDEKDVVEDGCNGKMTEIHAALGLANLKYYDAVLADRKYKYLYYKNCFKNCLEMYTQEQKIGTSNYSYFPVVFNEEDMMKKVICRLAEINIYPRRYFYPTVNSYEFLGKKDKYCDVAENVSKKIICIPSYYGLTEDNMGSIVKVILSQRR